MDIAPDINPIDILYDKDSAQRQIDENGSIYGITSIEDLILNENDFNLANEFYLEEAKIIYGEDNNLTEDGLLKGIIYCLLTPMQNYSGQINGFESLLDENKDIMIDLIDDKRKLGETLKDSGIIFHVRKASYIHNLHKKWDGKNVLQSINEGIKNDRDNEIHLRKNMISEIKGFGEKTASIFLRMCGAEFLIPVDSWMVEMLSFHGYPCEMPRTSVDRVRWGQEGVISRKLRKRGLKGKPYREAEEYAFDLAEKYDVPGYLLQLAFWTKKSTYNMVEQ